MNEVFRLCVLPNDDYSIAMANIVRPCMLSKGDDGMPRLKSSIIVCDVQ